MRVIKIDSEKKTVHEMEVNINSASAMKAIGLKEFSELENLPGLDIDNHELFVDDHAYKNGKVDDFFILNEIPYKGNAVVIGLGGVFRPEGWCAATCSVEDVKKRITFPIKLHPLNAN